MPRFEIIGAANFADQTEAVEAMDALGDQLKYRGKRVTLRIQEVRPVDVAKIRGKIRKANNEMRRRQESPIGEIDRG